MTVKVRVTAAAAIVITGLFACAHPGSGELRSSIPSSSRRAKPAAATTKQVRAADASASAPAGSARGAFDIHEWGLFGFVSGTDRARIATGVLPGRRRRPSHMPRIRRPAPSTQPTQLPPTPIDPGPGSAEYEMRRMEQEHRLDPEFHDPLRTPVGKPVLYVHLAEGTASATFDVAVEIPQGRAMETWPAARLAPGSLRWGAVHATRGACEHPSSPPTPGSRACRSVSDRFCEASEIPRYAGDDDTCLEVAASHAGLLFYRAASAPLAAPPLTLRVSGDTVTVARATDGPVIAGPIFLIRRADASVRIRALTPADLDRPLPLASFSSTVPREVRIALQAYAHQRGLTARESDAMVDAWAPAYFDTCRRSGPEASGRAPSGLAQADLSLLYFAPDAFVEAMLPLVTVPAARATHRVFLVRVVASDAPTVLQATPGRLQILSDSASLGRDAVPDVTRSLHDAFVSCQLQSMEPGFVDEGRIDPRLPVHGTSEFQIGLDADGRVVRSEVVLSTLTSARVLRCAQSAVQRSRFPAGAAAESTRNVRITADFPFAP